MKAVTVKELRAALSLRSPKELTQLCLRLSTFKKDNKELLTYLLFEAADEAGYIESVKGEIDQQLEAVNRTSYYTIRKGIRKTLQQLKKYIRYSKQKETEVELLIFFCRRLQEFSPPIQRSTRLQNVYDRQLAMVKKKLSALHEDLQYDYQQELDALGAWD